MQSRQRPVTQRLQRRRLEWISALDKLEALKPKAVVAGHKVPEFPAKQFLFNFILGTIMVPSSALVLPLFLMLNKVWPGQHDVGRDPAELG